MDAMTRRELMLAAGAVMAGPLWVWAQGAGGGRAGKGKRVVFFTKSQTFPHSVVTRKAGEELAFGEKLLKRWGEEVGMEVVVTKEGNWFTQEHVAGVDAFVFYTTGDLTKPPRDAKADQTSAMTAEGKALLLEAVRGGKGFVGIHSATDTFYAENHAEETLRLVRKGEAVDPYIEMIGGEFTMHGAQQKAVLRAGPGRFPGLEGMGDEELLEEWYGFTRLQRDLQVIQVLDTGTMPVEEKTGLPEKPYQGPAYPLTWARRHGKGRVFSTGLGHREDVWEGAMFKRVVMAGLLWASGAVAGGVVADVEKVCPLAGE